MMSFDTVLCFKVCRFCKTLNFDSLLHRAPDVPPDASITYELELLEVTEPVDFETVTEEEVILLV